MALIHRSFIKSYRDIIAYGIRIAMYMGLAVMMGTVWLRLNPNAEPISSLSSTQFSSVVLSCLSWLSPTSRHILEDRALFIKERANGLYGPTSFLVANFITGIPVPFPHCPAVLRLWPTGSQTSDRQPKPSSPGSCGSSWT